MMAGKSSLLSDGGFDVDRAIVSLSEGSCCRYFMADFTSSKTELYRELSKNMHTCQYIRIFNESYLNSSYLALSTLYRSYSCVCASLFASMS